MTRPAAPGGDVTETGLLLECVHRQLVHLHISLATADEVSRKLRSRLIRELMDAIRDIGEDPEFQAAADAESERRRTNPTPDERAAQDRGRAVVERFKRARDQHRREEQQARERADVSGG